MRLHAGYELLRASPVARKNVLGVSALGVETVEKGGALALSRGIMKTERRRVVFRKEDGGNEERRRRPIAQALQSSVVWVCRAYMTRVYAKISILYPNSVDRRKFDR